MIPREGGPYVYARRAFGDFAGFVVSWSDWFGNTASLSYLSIALAEYLIALFAFSFAGVVSIAIGLLLLLTCLHWIGLRAGSETPEVTSFLRVGVVLAVV